MQPNQYQRTPQEIRDLVLTEIRAHTAEPVAVPLPEPTEGISGANWKMRYSGPTQLAPVFYAAVQWVQRRFDAYEPAVA